MFIGRLFQTLLPSRPNVLPAVSLAPLQPTLIERPVEAMPKSPALLQREQELAYVSKAVGLPSSLHEHLKDLEDPILDPLVLDLSEEDDASDKAIVVLTQTNLRDDGEFLFYVPACEEGESLLFGCVDVPAQATYILTEAGRPHAWWFQVSRAQARQDAVKMGLMPS